MGHAKWLSSFVASHNRTGEFAISVHTTFNTSEANTYPALFKQIDNQFAKVELPTPRYWDTDEYIHGLISFILYSLGVTLEFTGEKEEAEAQIHVPESAVNSKIEAILPARRLFVFLCAARRMVVDLQNGKLSGYRASFDLREKVAPWVDNHFREACRLAADSKWLGMDNQLIAKIADMVRKVVSVGYSHGVGLTGLYPAFWRNIEIGSQLFQDELRKIEANFHVCKNEEDRNLLTNLQQYMQLLTDPDRVQNGFDEALADENQNQIADTIWKALMAIEKVFELEAIPQMHDWLKWIRPHIGRLGAHHKGPHVRKYCVLWTLLSKYLPAADEECLMVLRAYQNEVPYQYGEFLLDTIRDKEWVAFHLAKGHLPIDDISKSELKIVEKRSMQVLLPLYFQGVERYVGMKNRQAYKYAVRLLKKISSHYKKAKQTDRFEIYLQGFSKRHARLRALHEEMRKGRLIS